MLEALVAASNLIIEEEIITYRDERQRPTSRVSMFRSQGQDISRVVERSQKLVDDGTFGPLDVSESNSLVAYDIHRMLGQETARERTHLI